MGEILSNIGAAFIGGVILNIMPCVLPVLTMKVFHVVKKAQDDPSSNRKHGLAYAAGVVSTFVLFALLVIAMRTAIGVQFQWGQQYSKPQFLSAVVALMYVFGLNALGVFEITVGMDGGESRGGYLGSAMNGVVASIMATPCSAPFLGAAATYALGANSAWWQTLTMFSFIGIGLAFPFVLISFVPAASKALPKPGEWMESFKQLMGFTLLGAAVYYFRSLQKQISVDGSNSFLFFLLAAGVALWATQKFGGFEHGAARRWGVRAAALVTSIGLGYVLLDFAPPAKAMTAPLAQCADGGASAAGSTEIAPVVEDGKIKWTPFNAALLDAELARGRPVFVDFTADWCVNCKTNDRLFIEVDQIRADLTKSKILPMKVDLTTDEAQDEMKPLMDKLGRAAIPIYVVYHPDKTYDLLPESITTAMLSESLNKASAKFPPDGFKALSRPNAASSAALSTAAPSTAAPSAASSASAPAPAPSISASF
jgi:thiol:disulfide interchange protein DsbD